MCPLLTVPDTNPKSNVRHYNVNRRFTALKHLERHRAVLDNMKAMILSFRRGRHTQRTNQFLLEAEGIDTLSKASQLIGRRVVWTSPAKKLIYGKISQPHGNNGVLRARFSKGLPGTALGTKVEIVEKAKK